MNITNILLAVATLFIIGGLLGLLLAVASKYLEVKEDERVRRVQEMLPGYNCGACGEPGCNGLAIKLVNGEAKRVSLCKPIKEDAKIAIKEYLNSTPGPDGKTVKVDLQL